MKFNAEKCKLIHFENKYNRDTLQMLHKQAEPASCLAWSLWAEGHVPRLLCVLNYE